MKKFLVLILTAMSLSSCVGCSDNQYDNRNESYNGSEQQRKDLEAIDEYAKDHPEFW